MKSQGQELKNTSGTATQLLQKGLHGLFRIHREQCLEKQTENLMKTNFESFRYIHSGENHIFMPSTSHEKHRIRTSINKTLCEFLYPDMLLNYILNICAHVCRFRTLILPRG